MGLPGGSVVQPQASPDRQRLLRSLDGLAERIDRLISLAESDDAGWRSGRRDLAEAPPI
jgi:hypothetical protein